MRHLVSVQRLETLVEVESAGTAGYHAGEPPDPRSRAAALRRGIAVEGRAAQFVRTDFQRFDHVLAMDRSNQQNLIRLATTTEELGKIALLRSFDPRAPEGAEVPDPYYGGERGFEDVLDICTAACEGLLAELRRRHGW